MNKTLTAGLALGAGLLTGCTVTGPGTLRIHEALLYGAAQERIVWVYGALGSGGQGSLRLGGAAVELRPQVRDPLALPGTLSVNGQATYRGPTAALAPKLAVTRDTLGRFNVTLNEARGAVYYTDGRGWTRVNGVLGAGLTGTAVRGLRGAGNLTDAEADALGGALLNQGTLAVAVLNEAAVPDARLTAEPAPAEYRRTALYLLPGVPTVAAPSAPVPPAPPTAGGRVPVTELASGTNAAQTTPSVQLATTQSALGALYRAAYGNQTGAPPVPPLRSGETVVGVFLGQRPTGGYGVRVTGASAQGDTLTLTVEVRAPGPETITTQALTSPWTLVRVPGSFRSVGLVDASGRPLQLGTGAGQTR